MTIDESVDKLGEGFSFKKNPQQREKVPFQVVLVDIEQAANNKVIRCVKKPLNQEDLKFIALSYRWGELHETLIDTEVGYTATITSFFLDDFYRLCEMMTMESDLKHIKYVWVDAICVDQRPTKRKATIYQMSNIYNRATYILAVPDLHLTYLKRVSQKNNETIEGSNKYRKNIYRLIQGNTSKLADLDEDFLDDSVVPKSPPALRQLLLKYTDHFTDGFMKFQTHDRLYCPLRALDHICESSQEYLGHWKTWMTNSKTSINNVHQCYEPICPLALFGDGIGPTTLEEIEQFVNSNWKSKVLERSNSIRQSMEFLTDLILDWSSRVWVISEFSIAKTKNNLKYWFIQLALTDVERAVYENTNKEFTFFKFDFHDTSFSDAIINARYYANQEKTISTNSRTTNPVYIRFHHTMIHQLSQQTFLEMILSSKASRNGNKFNNNKKIKSLMMEK
ncbi:hypothetical protein BCR42DRAFT_213772 [Absidia repens]|uniref:Heterokaryon incompatibility domain-containing protein n=1 Tax=Absidia repens TaxID=90262 RepID=A0A1X2HK77_9FUNG|nr:hypothetical protein BCR42DRAFT_213772 [Absidia repens]